jgi:hypothetical protein
MRALTTCLPASVHVSYAGWCAALLMYSIWPQACGSAMDAGQRLLLSINMCCVEALHGTMFETRRLSAPGS